MKEKELEAVTSSSEKSSLAVLTGSHKTSKQLMCDSTSQISKASANKPVPSNSTTKLLLQTLEEHLEIAFIIKQTKEIVKCLQ